VRAVYFNDKVLFTLHVILNSTKAQTLFFILRALNSRRSIEIYGFFFYFQLFFYILKNQFSLYKIVLQAHKDLCKFIR